MIIEKLSHQRRLDSEVSKAEDLDTLPPLEPHGPAQLEGILCCGAAQTRSRARILDIAMPSLTNLIRQATDWGEAPEDEDRLGDYRFLILSLQTGRGIDAYVQLWSEARGNVIIEVGPGDRPDARLQAFADTIREALLDRGFQIGGNADNFRKELAFPAKEDAGRFAREMIALLIDVLGYDGTVDLSCRFEQASHLRDGHVLSGISRHTLRFLMEAWGLCPSTPADMSDVLHARNLYQEFRVLLLCPQAHRKDHFWEVHCFASVTLRADRAAALIANVNGQPYLLKACAVPGATEAEQEVRFAQGINLAGGVTPTHIRDQIFEFLSRVRKLPGEV